MSDERLDGWNKQDLAFNYAKDREFGPGLRRAARTAERLMLRERKPEDAAVRSS